uniref:Uncharacterized protein n=1 Tax=Streptomyces sp. NBC_01393 TaxID=2903851 RepID=A0AAU3IAA7_9ACTN
MAKQKHHHQARKALRTYVAAQGAEYRAREPRDSQASDLITDLLLTFSRERAAEILRIVERDNDEDRD